MLEDRIIVQDRGIDAGLAALIQNANKGNMDPAALQEIINIVRNQYDTYKQRKEAIAKCDEEMAKCQALLDKLGINDKPAKENDEIIALQKEVNELKNIIRKANQMVPPPMKEMLPQDMKNAMDKVGQ